MFNAAEALQKGLVHRIADDLRDEVRKTVDRIAQGAPRAARMNKKLARRLSPQPPSLNPAEISEAYALTRFT